MKINKSIAQQLRALAKSFDSHETEVKTFADSDIGKAFADSMKSVPEILRPQIEAARENAEKAFAKEHGDAEKQAKAELRKMLGDGFRAILDECGLSLVKASNPDRKERVTLTPEQKEQVCAIRRAYFAEKEKPEDQRDGKVIAAGQLGAIADRFNVSVPTVSNILDENGLTNKRPVAA